MSATTPTGAFRADEAELARLLTAAAAGLPEPSRGAVLAAAPRLGRLGALILEENLAVNLLSATDAAVGRLVERHLLDSLWGLPLLPDKEGELRVLDVGSGAGFPALPLAVVRPETVVTLVESTGKKARVLERLCEALGLRSRIVVERFDGPLVELLGRDASPDVLTTRGVARAGQLARLGRSLLGPSGRALLWTTRSLEAAARREARYARERFVPTPGSEERGILVLECST